MDWDMEILTKSAGQTQSFGQSFANNLKGGEVLALVGNLGSGKTTFIQGLAKGLGIKERIVSPTFILMREYPIELGKKLYHLDLYRLDGDMEKEIQRLGLQDLWGKSENIMVVEWADKAKDFLPRNSIWIRFENQGEDERKIEAD